MGVESKALLSEKDARNFISFLWPLSAELHRDKFENLEITNESLIIRLQDDFHFLLLA